MGVAVAACAPTPDPVTPTPTPSPMPVASPSPSLSLAPVPVAPLTGLPLVDEAIMSRPAVALKVPNLQSEQPQRGLLEADIVFCQPNDYGATRLAPVFHSRYADAVGPIRSIRPADVPLLSPLRPVFGNTGAADWVLAYTDEHAEYLERMTYLDWRGTGAYSVDQDRLYTVRGKTQYDRAIQAHPARMAELAERNTEAPEPYFSFAPTAEAASTATGSAATSLVIPYGSGHEYDMTYEYDAASNTYLRSQPWGEHILADGERVTADAVLIIVAPWEMGRIGDGRHADDPILEIIDAAGDFHYAHGGKVVTGRWGKGTVGEPFNLRLTDGSSLLMAPGRTWVELPSPQADLQFS